MMLFLLMSFPANSIQIQYFGTSVAQRVPAEATVELVLPWLVAGRHIPVQTSPVNIILTTKCTPAIVTLFTSN